MRRAKVTLVETLNEEYEELNSPLEVLYLCLHHRSLVTLALIAGDHAGGWQAARMVQHQRLPYHWSVAMCNMFAKWSTSVVRIQAMMLSCIHWRK